MVTGCAGLFACYTYITPVLTEVAGFSGQGVTVVLALFGVGMTLGNLIGGYAADRALRPSISAAFLLMALALALFAVTAGTPWAAALTVVLIGLFGFATVPTVQTLVMQKARTAPTLASATVQGAFNLANAQGAYLGSLALSAGLGWTSPTLVGSGLALTGCLVATAAWALDRPSRRSAPVEPAASPAVEPVG
ncbi:hypothetical protein GCM10020229_16260 [Kitasatospora albolonga]